MEEGCCATRYPVLFIHGTGFRDRQRLGYWGRIPQALQARGARVFFGGQDSWATVEQNAALLMWSSSPKVFSPSSLRSRLCFRPEKKSSECLAGNGKVRTFAPAIRNKADAPRVAHEESSLKGLHRQDSTRKRDT